MSEIQELNTHKKNTEHGKSVCKISHYSIKRHSQQQSPFNNITTTAHIHISVFKIEFD